MVSLGLAWPARGRRSSARCGRHAASPHLHRGSGEACGRWAMRGAGARPAVSQWPPGCRVVRCPVPCCRLQPSLLVPGSSSGWCAGREPAAGPHRSPFRAPRSPVLTPHPSPLIAHRSSLTAH